MNPAALLLRLPVLAYWLGYLRGMNSESAWVNDLDSCAACPLPAENAALACELEEERSTIVTINVWKHK